MRKTDLIDPFYLLWSFSLRCVREQWRRIALMQTNREDCGSRYREIMLPRPPSMDWAVKVSSPFRDYFETIAHAKSGFLNAIASDRFDYVANIRSTQVTAQDGESAPEANSKTRDGDRTSVRDRTTDFGRHGDEEEKD